MKKKCLMLCLWLIVFAGAYAQTPYSNIVSCRVIQKHHLPERIKKIEQIDPVRLQVLWNYFTTSFSFSSPGTELSIKELLNIQLFDVSKYEYLRQTNEPVHFLYKGSIQISLKSNNELNNILQGYDLASLLTELPSRPFPQWIGLTCTDSDFKSYKERVWGWAKDYPQDYLVHTSNTAIIHIRFSELVTLSDENKQEILSSPSYIIID